jgi:hypothetical protein
MPAAAQQQGRGESTVGSAGSATVSTGCQVARRRPSRGFLLPDNTNFGELWAVALGIKQRDGCGTSSWIARRRYRLTRLASAATPRTVAEATPVWPGSPT